MNQHGEKETPGVQEAFAKLGYDRVKPEQMAAVEVISGMDVFVTLPTGFGKSLIFATLVCPLLGTSLLF